MSQPVFRLYDTLTRTVKPLVLAEPGHLRFYSCGPTVYSYAHIGNFRTFLTGDLVVRTAEGLGWKVSYVSNITDVGHLTSDDEESGEDRMEKGLKSKEGERFVNVWDLADYYADCFKQDWDRLNLRRPLVWPRATQHMREQILAIEQLVTSGNAYETPTGVYFSVESFDEYGKLSGNRDRENLYQAVRNVVQDENKRSPADFALWKKDDKHLMQWYSPWGWGFPGWHIECSVMAMQYLGETIDLHAGGEDLVFPHHECEIAQSECLTHKPFANHWMHTRFLQVDGEKMSKSLGNFYTVRDLVEGKGVDPLALRYALISVPYGKPLNFTMQTLRDATKNIERYRECERLARAAQDRPMGEDRVSDELDALAQATLEALCDDLNTSVALAKALEGTGVIFREGPAMTGASARSALRYLQKVGDLLGIVRIDEGRSGDGEGAREATGDQPPHVVVELAERRQEAKRSKDFALADRLRAEIEAEGWEVRDTPEGSQIRRKAVEIG